MPQAWFWHFYALGAAVNAVVIVCACSHLIAISAYEQTQTRFVDSRQPQDAQYVGSCEVAAAVVALAMFQLHLLRRFVESVCIMKCAPGRLAPDTCFCNFFAHMVAYLSDWYKMHLIRTRVAFARL